jgi:hypothetical protein
MWESLTGFVLSALERAVDVISGIVDLPDLLSLAFDLLSSLFHVLELFSCLF